MYTAGAKGDVLEDTCLYATLWTWWYQLTKPVVPNMQVNQ